jgi:lysophospholipase L1-like esterase
VRWGVRFAALGLGIALSIGAGELAVRWLRPASALTYSELSSMVGSQYRASEFNPFTLKPNFEGWAPSQEFPGRFVRVTTNSVGLRGREIAPVKPDDLQRVLVLGDSYTFGVFVNDQQTYSAVLERLLRRSGLQVEVLNAGYASGWETDHQYCWLVNRGFDFEPDVVVLGFFTGNDIMNIRPEHWVERDERGLPTRIVDPSVYVDTVGRLRRNRAYEPDEIKEMDVVERTVGDELVYRVPFLRESYLFVFVGVSLERLFREVQRPEGWEGDRLSWYPHIFQKKSDRFDEKERYFLRLVRGMAEVTEEHGARFLVLMIPFNFQVDPDAFLPKVFPQLARKIQRGRLAIERNYFEDLKPKLAASGIEYLDVLELMQTTEGRFYPRNGEVHFNPKGHELVATHLFRKLTRPGWLR